MTTSEPTFNYDELSDTLYVSFSPGGKGTGIELNDHILLRIDREEHRAVGLSLLDYSLLTQSTDVGPRSFPLTGLALLSAELREAVVEILRCPPVSDLLSLSSYTPSFAEAIPITSLQPRAIAAA